MHLRKLGRLVFQSLRRNKRDVALSSLGIVVGVGTLLLFTALGAGIKSAVLEEIFVVRQLEVVPESVSVGGGLFGGDDSPGLDPSVVDELREQPGVRAAYPKMKLTFPASVRGGKRLVGRNLVAEFVGDGIPPRLVEGELDGDLAFRDWGELASCSSDEDCGPGRTCGGDTCERRSCTPSDSDACGSPAYCHDDGVCRVPIPVIASPQVLEIYNSNLQTALQGSKGAAGSLPNLSADMLVGFEFEGIFGQSYLGRSAQGDPIRRRMRLVGFSDRAIRLGATMPIGYVERLNRQFGSGADGRFHAIVVETETNDDVARVAQFVRDDLGLNLSDEYERAQRASLLIMVLTIVFNTISLVILIISAINIMHTFLMILVDRRREIGLMRALGATSSDIRWTILGESTVVGLVGGTIGLLGGWGVIELVDYLFATQVGDFPFKPDSLFSIQPWMLGAGLAVALAFCWIGALVPAIRASRVDPAEALTGR